MPPAATWLWAVKAKILFEKRKVSSQLQGFWHSSYKFKKNNTTRGKKSHWIAFHRQEKKRDLLKKNTLVGVAFFSAVQILASLQWQNTAYKKKTWLSLPRARAHRALYMGTHSPGCSKLQRAGTLENTDHMIFLPPPSTPPLPPPFNSNTSCKQACS